MFNTAKQTPVDAFAELSRVAVVRALHQGDDIVPEGAVGTIVHVYAEGEAFEVEFSTPAGTVILAKRGDVSAHPLV